MLSLHTMFSNDQQTDWLIDGINTWMFYFFIINFLLFFSYQIASYLATAVRCVKTVLPPNALNSAPIHCHQSPWTCLQRWQMQQESHLPVLESDGSLEGGHWAYLQQEWRVRLLCLYTALEQLLYPDTCQVYRNNRLYLTMCTLSNLPQSSILQVNFHDFDFYYYYC